MLALSPVHKPTRTRSALCAWPLLAIVYLDSGAAQASSAIGSVTQPDAPGESSLSAAELEDRLWSLLDSGGTYAAADICQKILNATPESPEHGAMRERALIVTVNALLRVSEAAQVVELRKQALARARDLIDRYFVEFVRVHGRRPASSSTAAVYRQRILELDAAGVSDRDQDGDAQAESAAGAQTATAEVDVAQVEADASPPPLGATLPESAHATVGHSAPVDQSKPAPDGLAGHLDRENSAQRKARRLGMATTISGWTTFAASGAFWVAGGMLLSRYHEDPDAESKNAEYKRSQAWLYSLGAVTTSVGAGLGVLGSVLLSRARKRGSGSGVVSAQPSWSLSPMLSRARPGLTVQGRF